MASTKTIYPHLSLLAKRINSTITIFDFETTGLLDADELGITEIATLSISPSGNVKRWSSLINPNADIPEVVSKLTGITDDMVVNSPNFKQIWPQISNSFENNVIFGFNSNKFDVLVLDKQIERYGVNRTKKGWNAYDARTWHQIAGNNGPKGTLRDVAMQWNVAMPGAMHRAAADVEVTAGIMEALLSEYGISPLRDGRISFSSNGPLISIIQESKINASNQANIQKQEQLKANEIANIGSALKQKKPDALSWVTSEISVNGYQPLAIWAAKLSLTQTQLEELLETALDSKILPISDFAHEPTQQWINRNNRLKSLLEYAYPTKESIGKLHHPYQVLWTQFMAERPPEVILDYVQLRIAMQKINAPYITRRGMLEAEAISEPTVINDDNNLELFPEPSIPVKAKIERPRFFS